MFSNYDITIAFEYPYNQQAATLVLELIIIATTKLMCFLSHFEQQLLAQRPAAAVSSAAADTGYADENLHYTNDHPKPLAVCTFGGRRIGGLLIADRSQFLTRKLVRVAITSNGGVHRLTNLGNQQQLTGHVTAQIHQV